MMDHIDRLKIEKEHLLGKLAKIDKEIDSLALYRGYAEHDDFILDMIVKFNDLYRGRDIELSIPATINVLVRYVFQEDYIFNQCKENICIQVFDIGLEDTSVSDDMIKDLFHEFPSNNSFITSYEKCKSESEEFKAGYDAFVAEFDAYMVEHDLDDNFKNYFIMKYYS
jgi:hypothetical protein